MQQQEVRLNVYRNNVVVSLMVTLYAIFFRWTEKTLVGEVFFRAMARNYI